VRTGIAVKIFDFFANRFGATLIFPWVNFGLTLVQGLACDFFQLNSNSSGRDSPKGTL
jgi:hypothetical protein